MNRRAFLVTLGGAISAIAAKPVMALVPAEPVRLPLNVSLPLKYYSVDLSFNAVELDLINAIAFSIHSQWVPQPSHQAHYRQRAYAAMAVARAKAGR